MTQSDGKLIELGGKILQVWEDFSARDIPDEMQMDLVALADMGEQRSWGVGKYTEVLDRALQAEGKFVPRGALYASVAQHAKASAESVRMWHRIFLAVPGDVRMEYEDRISFHQFKAIVPHAKTSSEWAGVINRWLDYAANSGHSPGSVDGLRAWLKDQQGVPPPEVGRHQRIGKAIRKQLENPNLPDRMRQEYRKFQQAVSRAAMATPDPVAWSWDALADDEEGV